MINLCKFDEDEQSLARIVKTLLLPGYLLVNAREIAENTGDQNIPKW